MILARDEKLLKRRLDDYLWRDKSKTVSALRQLLIEQFGDFDKVSIFGGMIRDIARSGARGFRSDVDIVIHAPSEQVEALAERVAARPNAFGGFGFTSTRWKVDFWALETTWAHRQGYITASTIDDLLEGTFFDWDSVHYDIKSRQLRAQDGYLERIRSRTLGVNLTKTPSTLGNAARAIRRILIWDLRASPALIDFIEKAVADEGMEALIAYEIRKYRGSVCKDFRGRDELLAALNSGNARVHVTVGSPRQLELLDIFGQSVPAYCPSAVASAT
jgi:hypothetical protein